MRIIPQGGQSCLFENAVERKEGCEALCFKTGMWFTRLSPPAILKVLTLSDVRKINNAISIQQQGVIEENANGKGITDPDNYCWGGGLGYEGTWINIIQQRKTRYEVASFFHAEE